jgi:hypothetical protein
MWTQHILNLVYKLKKPCMARSKHLKFDHVQDKSIFSHKWILDIQCMGVIKIQQAKKVVGLQRKTIKIG